MVYYVLIIVLPQEIQILVEVLAAERYIRPKY